MIPHHQKTLRLLRRKCRILRVVLLVMKIMIGGMMEEVVIIAKTAGRAIVTRGGTIL